MWQPAGCAGALGDPQTWQPEQGAQVHLLMTVLASSASKKKTPENVHSPPAIWPKMTSEGGGGQTDLDDLDDLERGCCCLESSANVYETEVSPKMSR